MSFADFVLSRLEASSRVLEIGCGPEGGVTPSLLAAGHDVLAIDPNAPDGPPYRRLAIEELSESDAGTFDAVVAGRVLHHLTPLPAALDKLARLAPTLIVDEFAWDHLDEPTIAWYEAERSRLVDTGREPKGPPTIEEWYGRHAGLHPWEVLKAELDRRYAEALLEWLPYLSRWLEIPEVQLDEEQLIAAGTIRPIGVRYVGVAR